jgi:thymidine kinase
MSLKLILGCMFAGKTTELVKEYNKWTSIGVSVLCINFIEDNRYKKANDTNMYTHNGINLPAINLDKLSNLDLNILSKFDIILINEGQFFSDLYSVVISWVNIDKKDVIICGLDGDYLGNTFGDMLKLVPHCDEVIKLKAYCHTCKDGTPAIYTHRLSNDTSQKMIGVDYIPLCRKHYNN